MACGENRNVLKGSYRPARNEVALADALYFVAEKFDTDINFVIRCRKYFNHVAAHTERRTRKVNIFTVILSGNEFTHKFVAIDFHSLAQRDCKREILFGRAETVYARNRRHDDNVVSFGKRTRRAVTKFIYFVVYGKIFFDIGIRRRYIRFGLIIIVVTNEIFNPVFGEKLP